MPKPDQTSAAGEIAGEAQDHGDACGASRVARGEGWELRLGDWRDVLTDVTADALITDPPYSERTHAGQGYGAVRVRDLQYTHWSRDQAAEFAGAWARRTRGWCVVFSDHGLQRDYERAFEVSGRYVFAPLPQVTANRTVRLAGDGPSSWTSWITVARPKTNEFSNWGTLPGAYIDGVGDRGRGPGVVLGAKPVNVMRAVVRDYSRRGGLIVDPCAGGATTLLAAVMEGRRAIGAEVDPETFDRAVARLGRGYTADLFAGRADDRR